MEFTDSPPQGRGRRQQVRVQLCIFDFLCVCVFFGGDRWIRRRGVLPSRIILNPIPPRTHTGRAGQQQRGGVGSGLPSLVPDHG